MAEIVRYRGDTKPLRIRFWQDKAAGVPADLDGYSVALTVDPQKAPVDNTNNLFTLDGVVETEGWVRFEISAEQADQTPGGYYYDIQLTDDLGYIQTIQPDKFKFVQDITKEAV